MSRFAFLKDQSSGRKENCFKEAGVEGTGQEGVAGHRTLDVMPAPLVVTE